MLMIMSFVDLQKGIGDPFIEELLGIAQVIVYNITQRQIDLDDYVRLKEEHPILKNRKSITIDWKIWQIFKIYKKEYS